MPRRLLPLSLLIFFLLACTCNPLTLPFAATPTRLPPSPTASTIDAQPTTIPPAQDTPVPPPAVSRDAAPFGFDWSDRSLFGGGLTAPYQAILAELPGVSVYHIALSLSDPPTALNGMEEVQYTNRSSDTLSQIEFAIFADILGGTIDIRNVSVDGRPVTAEIQTGFMRVPLETPLQPGKSVIIHNEFQVTIPTQGGNYYYGIFGYNDGILSLAHACPTVLVYDENGWNDQMPDLDGDPLFSETALYLVSVEAPADLVLVASGQEVERAEAAGRQTVLYADGPARDFYLAASQDFVKSSKTVGEVTLNSYALAGSETYNAAALDAAAAALQIFDTRYGPYPYTEFDILPIQTSAGGVEFPGLTSIADNLYNGLGLEFFEVVIVHELGHQWFYNLVGNKTQDQPWLDESLVQFITWQYYLDRYGAAAAQTYQEEDLKGTWDMVNDADIPIGKPVSGYSSDEYVAIIYGRGAYFFQALEKQMGQATFDKFLRDYVQKYSWKIATSDRFKLLAEQECNCDLTALFKEWINP